MLLGRKSQEATKFYGIKPALNQSDLMTYSFESQQLIPNWKWHRGIGMCLTMPYNIPLGSKLKTLSMQ